MSWISEHVFHHKALSGYSSFTFTLRNMLSLFKCLVALLAAPVVLAVPASDAALGPYEHYTKEGIKIWCPAKTASIICEGRRCTACCGRCCQCIIGKLFYIPPDIYLVARTVAILMCVCSPEAEGR